MMTFVVCYFNVKSGNISILFLYISLDNSFV